ncbi:cytochrome P450 705A22-like [Brassica napus]|uniref:cytochrome P450 705A22-like n=1 Tax=Brassica napus TaxID=3708 RepID=UPI0020794123|nr:cytochrome P450 705A22-like [Brassica napus]
MAATFIVHFENGFIFIIICLFSFLCYYFFFKKPNDSQGCDLPPSPPSLPIIGHLHLLLSLLVHKSLHKLSSKYGPILYLRVLIVPILLVSSASIAYEIFRAQDMNVSTRNLPTNEGSLFFGSSGLATAPYGDYWKFIKSSSPQSSSDLRPSRDKATKKESVEIAEEAMKLISNNMCKMLMGKSDHAEKVRGYNKVLEKSLVEYEEDHNQSCEMLDVLLEACQAEYKITRNHIKALFVDLFAANTDTSTNTIQWTMAKILERLREEIDSVVEKTRLIQETDLPNIPYLQAVVKEGLRLHPDSETERRQRDVTEMEDTRSGEELAVTPSSAIPQSANVQRLLDEVEWLRLGYEMVARNDRATMERFDSVAKQFDSVEKKIDKIGTKSNTRFESLEKRMSTITEILT